MRALLLTVLALLLVEAKDEEEADAEAEVELARTYASHSSICVCEPLKYMCGVCTCLVLKCKTATLHCHQTLHVNGLASKGTGRQDESLAQLQQDVTGADTTPRCTFSVEEDFRRKFSAFSGEYNPPPCCGCIRSKATYKKYACTVRPVW